MISDSIYHQEYNRSQKRVFLKLRNDPIINIFDTNLSSSFSLNTEIVSNMSNKFYREWGNHTLKSINGDSVKVRQMELSIDYNEKGLTDSCYHLPPKLNLYPNVFNKRKRKVGLLHLSLWLLDES